jgi:iron complex outermembrane receptor protein
MICATILGNDVAIKAYRDGKSSFPDGTIIARLSWKYVPSEENKAESINSDNQDRNAREARLRPLLRVAIVAFGAASAGLARAVSGDDATASPAVQQPTAGALQEVTVTARRTLENIETVPVAVQALSVEALKEQNITTETDLQAAVPGLLVGAGASATELNYAIRGQALDAFSYTSPTVLTYVDEFQVGGTTATTFYDMQSIQVVKGPQGTLFGRNATGGAILFTTTQPGNTLAGYLNLGAGNYSDKKAEGAITLPLASWASLRLAGEIEKRDGYENNVYLTGLGIQNGSLDNKNIRATLRLGSDQFENTTTGQYGGQGGYSGAYKITHANPAAAPPAPPGTCAGTAPQCAGALLYPPNLPTGGYNPTLLAQYNGMLNFINYQATQPFYDIFDDQTTKHDATLRLLVNKTSWTINDGLSLVNIAGYNNVWSRDKNDGVGSPFALLPISLYSGPNSEGNTFSTEQYSDELQLAGSALGTRLNYLLGAYFLRDFEGENIPLNVGCGSIAFAMVPGGCEVPGGFRYNFENDELSRALFAQADYEFVPGWRATAGFRETWEDVRFHYVHDSEPQDAHFLAGVPEPSLSDHKPSWTLGLDWQVTHETLLYITQRGSFRVGGFNGTSTIPEALGSSYTTPTGIAIDSFKPETVRDLELGIKFAGRIGGLPTRINADVYESRISDAQRVVYAGISSQTTNAKKAQIDGFEFEGLIDLTNWLQLGANYAYTDARYTDGTANFTRVAILTGNIVYEPIILGPYGDTPRQSGSFFVRVHHNLANQMGELVFRADAFFQTAFYYTNLAQSQPVALDPNTHIGGYSLANARIDWKDIARSKVDVSAYVRNMFDKHYEIGGIGLGAVVGTDGVILGEPRMWGVVLGVKF